MNELDDKDTLIELPNIDYQLEAALLVLRTQLIKEHGFNIMAKVKLGQVDQKQSTVVTN